MNQDELNRIAELSKLFVDDVMPQIGGLCIQDYAALNDLCILLERWSRSNAE